MRRSRVVFTASFAAVVLALNGCESREEEDDNYYDSGSGIYYHGSYYPYGTLLPNGYRSERNMGGKLPVVNGAPPSRTSTSGTTRGGFGRSGSGLS